MLKELINKLKYKKKQLKDYLPENKTEDNKNLEEDVDIIVSKENNFYKVEIADYVTIGYYVKKMRSSDEYKILDSICNCVLWCSGKQKVYKGIYYVIKNDNYIYNILFTDEKIEIDERINLKLDEDSLKENITRERVITYYPNKEEYHYYTAKHESNGNTYYTKYYNKDRKWSLGSLDLTEEETFDEVSSVINNLENIDGINTILDIVFYKINILNDLKIGLKLKKEI